MSQPASKLPDGTVNFGREAGEKGIWNLPYITNMGARNIVVGAPAAQLRLPALLPSVAAAEEAVAVVSVAERHPSHGSPSNPGLLRSTTIIR